MTATVQLSCNDGGQTVCRITLGIIWCWPTGSDASQLGRGPASMVIWHVYVCYAMDQNSYSDRLLLLVVTCETCYQLHLFGRQIVHGLSAR